MKSDTEPGQIWANDALDVDTGQIMGALDRGFPVSLIGTFENLVTCEADEALTDVDGRFDIAEFDYLPVIDGGRIIGLLNRHTSLVGDDGSENTSKVLVRDVFDPLDDRNIIAADAGILLFLLDAKTNPCRLIVTGHRISGLVSISDLQKLPVRTLLFHVVTHLELVMTAWIRQHIPNEETWLDELSDKRRRCLDERFSNLTKADLAIDRLSATMFADKRSVLVKLGAVSKTRRKAERELKRIEKLRDSLAHSGDYAITREAAEQMTETVALANSWIAAIPNFERR